ncbi:MAG: glucokinase [Gammaproteobacteria bacterium]
MATNTILAGDIGGTKTVLALVKKTAEGVIDVMRMRTFDSADYATFEAVLAVFLNDGQNIDSACFGVAGPVIEQRCLTTNLPWIVDGESIGSQFGIERVRLLNDLEAMALGMLHVDEKDLLELNPRAEAQTGNRVVIAAGTGLGEAILYWDGEKHRPIATEGGHADFAPQTDQQIRLLQYLQEIYPDHVSWERLVSGIGFSHIYDFLVHSQFAPPCPAVPPEAALPSEVDRNALISRLGVAKEDPLCAEVVRLFTELYGAEAGNLTLKAFAIGGVFIGGGIGPKIRPILESGEFIRAFTAKGRFEPLLTKVSVKLALNPQTPLLGAMHYFA